MPKSHELIESVRLYLLGTLSDPEASALEDRYFTDRAFLRVVEEIELGLIEEYLDNRLSLADRQRFESRYLQVEALRKKVDDCRLRRSIPSANRFGFFRSRYVHALATACLMIAAAGLWLTTRQRNIETVALLLTPGVYKSDGSPTPIWHLGAGDAELLLDFPGPAPSLPRARVSLIELDGTRKPLWESAPLQPSDGSRFSLTIPARLLVPGDYVVELLAEDSAVAESYLFQAQKRH